jgi:hypothetical protein
MLIYAVGGHDPPARRPYSGQRRGRPSGWSVRGRGCACYSSTGMNLPTQGCIWWADASCICRWRAARPLQPVVGRRCGEGSMQVDRRGQDTWTKISTHKSKIHCCTLYSMRGWEQARQRVRKRRRDAHESESARERAACL